MVKKNLKDFLNFIPLGNILLLEANKKVVHKKVLELMAFEVEIVFQVVIDLWSNNIVADSVF